MFRMLGLAPLIVPLIGGFILYKYRHRLKGSIWFAITGVILGVVSGILGVLGENLVFFDAQVSHRITEDLLLVRNILLAMAWLCLLAALKNRNNDAQV